MTMEHKTVWITGLKDGKTFSNSPRIVRKRIANNIVWGM
jgi:hypothetical protein